MSRAKRLRPLAGLVAMGLAAPAFAGQSVPFPTYQTGPQPNGSWVVSSGQIVTPAGVQVDLGDQVRAKAVAVNPNTASHTAAVLTMGAIEAVEVFDTRSGTVLQIYMPFQDSSGSLTGITYSADGKRLMFSQDSSPTPPYSSYIALANVSAEGLLTDGAHVAVPPNNSFITCYPNSLPGESACGTFYTPNTAYPGGVAFSKDGKSAYALLNQNNTLTSIDLTQATPVQGPQIRVGNAPHSILISADGKTAYVSDEGGRVATAKDFQISSAGTPIVADQTGAATTGAVSVVDLASFKVVDTIATGLHPTGMAFFGSALLVANTYGDSISVIDTATNKVMRTIDLGLPIKVPGESKAAYGAAPDSIAVDATHGVAYVALYNANAVAVVDLSGSAANPVMGLIPVAYAPSSVVLDAAENKLIVANDKGIGTRFSYETDVGVTGYNSHQDNATVSIVPVPTKAELAAMTIKVQQNNHWDLAVNIDSAAGGSKAAAPVALPAKIGDPSLIKHVFLIVRENRTYDQMLGDVAAGNGDPSLAVFGGADSPNVHALVKRFPLLDNFYTPSRQSADGHNWLDAGMATYADDIQSPDWVRSYPGGDAADPLIYAGKGYVFRAVAEANLPQKIYGEVCEYETFPGLPAEPSWTQFYQDTLAFESGQEKTLAYQNATNCYSPVPLLNKVLVQHMPNFDLNIPDQFRVDWWMQDFASDVKAGTVPALSTLWIMDDHTGGPPNVNAEQADNDLAVGRIIDIISHSSVWASSAIFIAEDDSQNGVDHVDGHRSPGYVVSPYVVQNGPTEHHYYTQVNMLRTIEQILGLSPRNQFDLVASPMTTLFVKGTPPQANLAPWDHVPNQVPLWLGVTADTQPQTAVAKAWLETKRKMFAGNKMKQADSVDPDTLSHLDWYEATDFKRPYPGEKTVRMPEEFKNRFAHTAGDRDD